MSKIEKKNVEFTLKNIGDIYLPKYRCDVKNTYVRNKVDNGNFIKISAPKALFSDYGKVHTTFKTKNNKKIVDTCSIKLNEYHETRVENKPCRLFLDLDKKVNISEYDGSRLDISNSELEETPLPVINDVYSIITDLKEFLIKENKNNINEVDLDKYIVFDGSRTVINDKMVNGVELLEHDFMNNISNNDEFREKYLKYKYSYHIIFTDVIFGCINTLGKFIEEFKIFLSTKYIDNELKNMTDLIDIQVYKKGNLRIPYSTSSLPIKSNSGTRISKYMLDNELVYSGYDIGDIDKIGLCITESLEDKCLDDNEKNSFKDYIDFVNFYNNCYSLMIASHVSHKIKKSDIPNDFLSVEDLNLKKNELSDVVCSYMFIHLILGEYKLYKDSTLKISDDTGYIELNSSSFSLMDKLHKTKPKPKQNIQKTTDTKNIKSNDLPIEYLKIKDKFLNIEKLKKCLEFIAENDKSYYEDFSKWTKICKCCKNLYKYYGSLGKNEECSNILQIVLDFSRKSDKHKNINNGEILNIFNGKISNKPITINTLYFTLRLIVNGEKKIGLIKYHELFPNKIESLSQIQNKFISKKIADYVISTNIISDKEDMLIKQFSKDMSSFDYTYILYKQKKKVGHAELKTTIFYIEDGIDKKTGKKKYIKTDASSYYIHNFSKYEEVFFDPHRAEGEYLKENGHRCFNSYLEIPYTIEEITNDDKDLILMNDFLEKICGKELNPLSYMEYYNYLLNWLAYLFINKVSTGVMVLFIGDGGSGKSMSCQFIKQIFTNEYSIDYSSENFNNCKFNAQIANKLICSIVEFKIGSVRIAKEKIDRTISKEITGKGSMSETKRTFENYVGAANEIDQKIDINDRRFFIINSGYKISDEYGSRVFSLITNQKFIKKFRGILVKRYENIKDTFKLNSFPISKLKMKMNENIMSEFTRFLIKQYYLISNKQYSYYKHNFINDLSKYIHGNMYTKIQHKDKKDLDKLISSEFKNNNLTTFAKATPTSEKNRNNKFRSYVICFPERLFEKYPKDYLINYCKELNSEIDLDNETEYKIFEQFEEENTNKIENNKKDEQYVDNLSVTEKFLSLKHKDTNIIPNPEKELFDLFFNNKLTPEQIEEFKKILNKK